MVSMAIVTNCSSRLPREPGSHFVSGDTLAHFGEDTLGVLLDGRSDPSEANAVAEPGSGIAQSSIPRRCSTESISNPVSEWPVSDGYFNSEDLLRDAATAMNRAKTAGRSQIELFDERMRQHVAVRVQKEADLRRAIERDEFQVLLPTDRFSRFRESSRVLRLSSDGRTATAFRLPGDFIPLAEETGLIIPIERFVLRNAVKQMREWESHLKLGTGITMSVNLSPQHYSEPDLVEDIKRLLMVTGFDPQFLKLEITESALMRDTEIGFENALVSWTNSTSSSPWMTSGPGTRH